MMMMMMKCFSDKDHVYIVLYCIVLYMSTVVHDVLFNS